MPAEFQNRMILGCTALTIRGVDATPPEPAADGVVLWAWDDGVTIKLKMIVPGGQIYDINTTPAIVTRSATMTQQTPTDPPTEPDEPDGPDEPAS
jgi:hypothetical protein